MIYDFDMPLNFGTQWVKPNSLSPLGILRNETSTYKTKECYCLVVLELLHCYCNYMSDISEVVSRGISKS
jgi:hypothetical protein